MWSDGGNACFGVRDPRFDSQMKNEVSDESILPAGGVWPLVQAAGHNYQSRPTIRRCTQKMSHLQDVTLKRSCNYNVSYPTVVALKP